jgi:hypothetical protein
LQAWGSGAGWWEWARGDWWEAPPISDAMVDWDGGMGLEEIARPRTRPELASEEGLGSRVGSLVCLV